MSTMEQLHAIPNKGCPCGREHPLITKEARVVDDAPETLRQALEKEPVNGRILIICDTNTREILGRRVETALASLAPLDVLELSPEHLHADERALGAALMDVKADTARIVAVGSGTVNDISRYVATRCGLPYDVVGTAASMDGYTSSVSPLLKRGFKLTFPGIAPTHALLDLPTMQGAPAHMTAAGLGDMLGKYISLYEWNLSHLVLGEYRCPAVSGLMRQALDTCVAQASGLPGRDAQAIANLGDGLLMSGVAMQLADDSRPASGSEHMLAHFWEMRQLLRDGETALHGDKVGIGTLVILGYYRLFFKAQRPFKTPDRSRWVDGIRAAYGPIADDVLADNVKDPLPFETIHQNALMHWDALKAEADPIIARRGEMEGYLKACGGPVRPEQLGIRKEDVRDALLFAKETRARFTILRLAFAWGIHEDIVEELMEELYD